MSIIVEFEIHETPLLFNATNRKHWTVKARQARKWKNLVAFKCLEARVEGRMLTKAKVTCVRHSSKECDFDSLVNSFKHCIDGLVMAKVIIDDKSAVIGQPSYSWVYRARKMGGKISMKVEVDSL